VRIEVRGERLKKEHIARVVEYLKMAEADFEPTEIGAPISDPVAS
jgi:hypothetical protein